MNGYKNYATWNVALWLLNTENLYFKMREFALSHDTPHYLDFVREAFLAYRKTGDGVPYLSSELCLEELDALLMEEKEG